MMIRDVCILFVRALKRFAAAHVQNIVFFSAPAIAKHTPPTVYIYIYKANLDPKLLPEPSFHPRRILFFLFSLFSPREIL